MEKKWTTMKTEMGVKDIPKICPKTGKLILSRHTNNMDIVLSAHVSQ